MGGDCFPGSGGELPLSPEDVFSGVAGGRGGGGAPAEYADAFGADEAPQGKEGSVQRVNPVADGAVGLEVEGEAAEVAR